MHVARHFLHSGDEAVLAVGGKPSADGLPDWPAYTTDKPATMVLDKESRVAVDLDRKLLQAAGAL